jgi:tetratricopeptide (TPR) repeat protein
MSTTTTTELTEPFVERVNRLFRELERAIKWDRPAILLAIYSSEFVRADAEVALTVKLTEIGQAVTLYRVAGEENADIPLEIAKHPDLAHRVFFVSGLRWGGGADERNTYRALNIRREYFVEERIRAVFWLTESEAIALPRHAPDFWAFRHRVVEFVEPPKTEQIGRTNSVLVWRDLESQSLGEDTDAKIELREALLRDLPDADETLAARGDLLYRLGLLYRAKGNNERALGLFQSALAIAERLGNAQIQAWCWNWLGNVYSDQGRIEEAITAYQRAIELDSKYTYPHNGLGNVYADQGRTEEAIAEYQRAIELDPKDANPHNGLGNVYADQGRTEEAVAEYQRAIELNPKDASPHHGLGNVYANQGRTEEAIAEYQRAIELDPKLAHPHHGLGNVYADQGRTEEAIAEYQRAIELDPKSAHPHNGLGNVYANLGRTEEAIAEYQRAIELDPKSVHPHNGLGNVYANLGRTEEAIAEYQRAIELDPKFAPSHHDLGSVYANLGRTEEAIVEYQRAIELDPKFAPSHHGLGSVYVNLGHTEEAIAEYQRAIELNPKLTRSYNGLGNIYRNLGRTQEAIVELQRAIESDSDNGNTHNSLGNVYADQGHAEQAIAEYQRAIELNPKQAYYSLYNLGNIYARSGRTNEAIGAYQRAVDLEPKRALARISLASCYRKQGRKDRYEKQIQAARQLLRKENEYGRALFHLVTGNKDKALELLKLALQKNQVAPAWVRCDPDFQSLCDDPRFKALVGE